MFPVSSLADFLGFGGGLLKMCVEISAYAENMNVRVNEEWFSEDLRHLWLLEPCKK
jgi:hypothetical protein